MIKEVAKRATEESILKNRLKRRCIIWKLRLTAKRKVLKRLRLIRSCNGFVRTNANFTHKLERGFRFFFVVFVMLLFWFALNN